MEEKRTLYARHGFHLVELADAELEYLDDNLARLLIQFGVDCIGCQHPIPCSIGPDGICESA